MKTTTKLDASCQKKVGEFLLENGGHNQVCFLIEVEGKTYCADGIIDFLKAYGFDNFFVLNDYAIISYDYSLEPSAFCSHYYLKTKRITK